MAAVLVSLVRSRCRFRNTHSDVQQSSVIRLMLLLSLSFQIHPIVACLQIFLVIVSSGLDMRIVHHLKTQDALGARKTGFHFRAPFAMGESMSTDQVIL